MNYDVRLFVAIVIFITMNFVTPVYKMLEVVYGLPYLNLASIRFMLYCVLVFGILINIGSWKIYAFRNLRGAILTLSILALLLVHIVFVFNFHTLLFGHEVYSSVYLLRVDSALVGYVLFIYSGYWIILSWEKIKKVLYFVWVIFTLFFLSQSSTLIALFFSYRSDLPQIGYIFLSNGYVLTSLIVLFSIRSISLFMVLLIPALVVLFLIPSRSNIVAFVVPVVMRLVMNIKKLNFSVFIGLLLLVVVFGSFVDWQLIEASRLVNTDIKSDSSLSARLDFMSDNFELFKEHWFVGSLLSDVHFHGSDGHYTHNYFSFWERFGLPAFFCLMLAFILGLVRFINCYNGRLDSHRIVSSLSIFALPLVLLARSFTDATIWFVLGAFMAIKWERVDKSSKQISEEIYGL